jgi:hypothetical protein
MDLMRRAAGELAIVGAATLEMDSGARPCFRWRAGRVVAALPPEDRAPPRLHGGREWPDRPERRSPST